MYNLINLKKSIKEFDLKIKGIVQIGASCGEEVDMFEECKIKDVIFIDANPLTMPELRRRVGKEAYHALIWNKDNEIVKFNILDFLACSTTSPLMGEMDIVKTIDLVSLTLETFFKRNTLDKDKYNMLFLDVEGAELKVLEGADLSKFDYIYTEFQSHYDNTVENLTAFLSGFEEVQRVTQTHKPAHLGEWGDILFKRK